MVAMVGRFQRRRLFNTASIWLALSLSACAYFSSDEPAPPPVVEPPSPPPVAAVVPPAPPRPVRKPTPPPAQQPAEQPTEQPAEQSTEPPPIAEREPVDPQHLIGLDERATESWLGAPNQRADAPPGTIWHYLSKDCQVDVYFYLDLQKGVMRALTYEVRSDDIVERRPERCFQQLVGEHRRRESNAASIGSH
jgi:hypothetical protein